MSKRYSLAEHILSIKPMDPTIDSNFGTITIGGEGSYTDSITVNQNNNLFDTVGFATGAWVHNKNLAKNGTVEINLSQISDQVKKLINLCETYYTGDYDGFTLTLTTNEMDKICTCYDCYIQNIPSQDFQATAQNQRWVFTCGKITFN